MNFGITFSCHFCLALHQLRKLKFIQTQKATVNIAILIKIFGMIFELNKSQNFSDEVIFSEPPPPIIICRHFLITPLPLLDDIIYGRFLIDF